MRKGKNVTIHERAKLVYPENITIGDNVIIDDFVFIVAKKPVSIGNYVHIASFASITGGGICTIGSYSTLSSGARIFTGTEDVDGESLLGAAIPEPYRKARRSFVKIGKHCMIGANSVILPGTSILEGTVVGAMSLVLEDSVLASWAIYAGCPARWLRKRPSERILGLEVKLENRSDYS